MGDDDIAKQMEKLIKKYKLPTFAELDNEFEVGTIETPCSSLLRAVRQKMSERIGNFIKMLDDLLFHPDNSYANIYELKAFTEAEHRKIFILYRNLMLLDRRSFELSLVLEEEQDAEFIKKTYKDWQGMKKELLDVAKRLRKSWETEEKKDDIASYFA